MSETGGWNTINRPGKVRPGSVGTARPGFEIKIVDDLDFEVPAGEVGEIVIRPQKPFIMFDGYYQDPAATVESSGNWWFHTGDLGKVSADGYYYFIGRKKEIIRRGGENISPYEIERVYLKREEIREAAAVGVPDNIMGEEIKIYIVPQEGKKINVNELNSWVKERLPRFMLPRYLEILEHIPKSSSEKTRRVQLKERGIGNSIDLKKETAEN
jgi:crotonobetaine/carnitine-CoA ligase